MSGDGFFVAEVVVLFTDTLDLPLEDEILLEVFVLVPGERWGVGVGEGTVEGECFGRGVEVLGRKGCVGAELEKVLGV